MARSQILGLALTREGVRVDDAAFTCVGWV
jgi:hypothetical protein